MNNNAELIAAGHDLAKCLDNEPLLDIAKMIVRLADKLEVTTLALREKTKQCEQLAAENDLLKSAHPQPFGGEMMKALDTFEKYQDEVPEKGMLDAFFILRDSIRVETPATDAFLREVRAQGVDMFADKCSSKSKQAISSDTRDSWWLCGEHASDFAAELRQGGAAGINLETGGE
ncbi:hypothetical protein SMC58_002787 [Cronobacter dublinensis]|nr:hypothetical protein [Cronobacter dublinensis]